MNEARLHGYAAEFLEPERLLEAIHAARRAGYTRMDAYTPYPVEGAAEALGMRFTGVPLTTLVCGILGGAGGYFMEYYSATIDYPLNIGGRPFHSWPSFIPITFELTVLAAAIGAVLSMLTFNGLPRPNHPIFEVPHFPERNVSRFYLWIQADDRHFHPRGTRTFLEQLDPERVWEVLAP